MIETQIKLEISFFIVVTWRYFYCLRVKLVKNVSLVWHSALKILIIVFIFTLTAFHSRFFNDLFAVKFWGVFLMMLKIAMKVFLRQSFWIKLFVFAMTFLNIFPRTARRIERVITHSHRKLCIKRHIFFVDILQTINWDSFIGIL